MFSVLWKTSVQSLSFLTLLPSHVFISPKWQVEVGSKGGWFIFITPKGALYSLSPPAVPRPPELLPAAESVAAVALTWLWASPIKARWPSSDPWDPAAILLCPRSRGQLCGCRHRVTSSHLISLAISWAKKPAISCLKPMKWKERGTAKPQGFPPPLVKPHGVGNPTDTGATLWSHPFRILRIKWGHKSSTPSLV